MNLESETELKIVNAREHLRIVLQDISIASSDLGKILKDIDQAKIALKNVNNDIVEKSKNAVIISEETQKKLRHIQVEQESLAREKEQLEKDKTKFDKEINDKLLLIDDLDNKFSHNVNLHKQTLKDFELKLQVLSDNILKLEKIESDLLSNIQVSTEELKDIENEITKKKEEKGVLENELVRFVANSKKEREEIEKRIQEERAKIVLPMQLLKETHDSVVRKERDVTVLIRRFRIAYAKLYPDKNPII